MKPYIMRAWQASGIKLLNSRPILISGNWFVTGWDEEANHRMFSVIDGDYSEPSEPSIGFEEIIVNIKGKDN